MMPYTQISNYYDLEIPMILCQSPGTPGGPGEGSAGGKKKKKKKAAAKPKK